MWTKWSNGYEKPILSLVGLFPMNKTNEDRGKFLAPGNVPAFHLAVKAVNKNESILPDHTLHQVIVNTACEPDMVMLEFIKLIQHFTKHGTYSKIVSFVEKEAVVGRRKKAEESGD